MLYTHVGGLIYSALFAAITCGNAEVCLRKKLKTLKMRSIFNPENEYAPVFYNQGLDEIYIDYRSQNIH